MKKNTEPTSWARPWRCLTCGTPIAIGTHCENCKPVVAQQSAAGDKVYLGDAVYAAFDGYQIILTTEDGLSTTNTIVLEPGVLGQLEKFVAKLRLSAKRKAGSSDSPEGPQDPG